MPVYEREDAPPRPSVRDVAQRLLAALIREPDKYWVTAGGALLPHLARHAETADFERIRQAYYYLLDQKEIVLIKEGWLIVGMRRPKVQIPSFPRRVLMEAKDRGDLTILKAHLKRERYKSPAGVAA